MDEIEVSRLSSAAESHVISVDIESFTVGAVLFIGLDMASLSAISTLSCRARGLLDGRCWSC